MQKQTKQLKKVRTISFGPVYVHKDICVLNRRNTTKWIANKKNNPKPSNFVNVITRPEINKYNGSNC